MWFIRTFNDTSRENEILLTQALLQGKGRFGSNLTSNREVPLGFDSGVLTLIVGTTYRISTTVVIVPTFS